ncbi:MAG: alpha-2-macroglobulin, partial [Candidatus Nanoarchaeia archaeon]
MQNTSQMRSEANALFKEGNYKSALELFKKLAVSENLDQKEATKDFSSAVSCLERLGKIDEFDAFAEEVAEKRKSSWRMLKTIADSYRKVLHDGYILEGVFYRGYNKSGGKYVSAFKRDHIRSFQLYLAAIERIPENESADDKFDLFMDFAGALKTFATYQEDGSYWKFQYLTDLSKLPDYEENNYQMRWGWRMFSDFTGAPVDNDGNPIFYQIPASFETAKNDGERWRFLLETAKKASPQQAGAVDLTFADFLNDQFGVQTIADSPVFQLNKDSYGYSSDDNYFSAVKLLSQLSDDETIAKLANGIRKFKLPDEFNPIKIYQKVSEGEDKFAESALSELAEIFTNRKQFSRAADCWRQSISRFGDSNKYKEGKLKDIVGNWGAFEPSLPQPSSQKTALPFKFR